MSSWLSGWLARAKRELSATGPEPAFAWPWRVWRFLRQLRDGHGHLLLILCCLPAVEMPRRLAIIFQTRLTYLAEVEWMEGGQLLAAHRVLHGLDVYVTPNQGYMPFPYPPLHVLTLAGVGALFGLDYPQGRVISVLSCGLTMWLLAREVTREWRTEPAPSLRERIREWQTFRKYSKSDWLKLWRGLKLAEHAWVWGVLAAAMAAAGFPICAAWYDVIRVDMLAMLLLVAAYVSALAVDRGELKSFWWCALFSTAAVFCKQTNAFFIGWLIVFLLLKRPRRAVIVAAVVALAISACLLLLQWLTDGQYFYYTVSLLKKHASDPARYPYTWQVFYDFAPYLPLTFLATGTLLLFGRLSRRALLWNGLLVVSVFTSMMSFAKAGGHQNVFLPTVFVMGPAALCLAGNLFHGAPASWRRTATLILAAAVGFYLESRMLVFKGNIATRQLHAAAIEQRQFIAKLGPGTLIPHHPFLAVKMGTKVEQVHGMAWVDALMANVPNLSFAGHIQRQRPERVILTGTEVPLFWDAVAADYALEQMVPEEARTPPLTGFGSQPLSVFRRRHTKQNADCPFDFENRQLPPQWNMAGDAFRFSPALPHPLDYLGMQGRALIHSAADGNDAATGTLTSSVMRLTRPVISLLVGGGETARTEVELLVNNRVVQRASGLGNNMLREVVWKVPDLVGRDVQLRIVDYDGTPNTGRILVDDICFEDAAAPR